MEPVTQAYWERTQLLLVLSKIFPSWLYKQKEDEEGYDPDFSTILFMDIPTKPLETKYGDTEGCVMKTISNQASWHLYNHDLPLFDHLHYRDGYGHSGWDGHTTEEKYKRLREWVKWQ